jgi:hypothetical protein
MPETPYRPGDPIPANPIEGWAFLLKYLAAGWYCLGYLYADEDRDAILAHLEPDELAIVLHVEHSMGVIPPPAEVLAAIDLVEAVADHRGAEHLARP